MPRPPRKNPKHRRPPKEISAAPTAWDPVAAWYDKLVGESGSDYHRNVILPAALRLLGDVRGLSVIDLCCGQGVLAGPLLEAGAAAFTGVDASPQLIAAARKRHGRDSRARFLVADATAPGDWEDASHDAAACLMAVHDVADLDGLCARLAGSLKPGGRAVLVFMHPCFRIPRQTHWGWDNDQKIQFRRVDRYISSVEIPIATHPGKATGEQTLFHHRPLGDVLNSLGRAGLAVTACEEPCSHRRSQPGPFSKAEHRAAAEIPVFLALQIVKTTEQP
ncbi:MAG: class I SAM-dependent methyltransferase [Akkermansiaceae bacterium]|nr:class I SAM-dependent methyltransferase [Akkermansiaceae bacterium]